MTESAVENHRVRKCTIYMYLEDAVGSRGEPRQPNSASQGVFLKRHRVPKDNEGGVFRPADISVGSTCTMYGRTFFFVVSCDAFTREYLTGALGLEAGSRRRVPG